ncbi:MAG: hypothetical protein GY854_13130, partial [Deltaproteobacteria bacterium]|nr:hypothetical protein [Deltaproteobacteria bacterium]
WGLPADELSVDVATRRLSGMSFGTLVKEILAPSRKADHIDGEFLYPQHGIGRIVEAMAATLPPGSIRKEHEVAKIVCRKGRVNRILFTNGAEVAPGSRVISTLPVGRMASLLGDAISPESRRAALRLRFRSLRLVFLRLARPRVSHNATIYLPQRDTSVSRVHEPKNRSPWMAPSNETSLVAEVPCFQGEQQCSAPDEQLAELVIDELASAKLIDRTQVLEWRHHLLPDAYPVYTLGYEQNVRAVLEGLSIIDNLDPIGRGGRFQYSQMHHQLRWSKQYVENRPWR